jgi:hypothetical protein
MRDTRKILMVRMRDTIKILHNGSAKCGGYVAKDANEKQWHERLCVTYSNQSDCCNVFVKGLV